MDIDILDSTVKQILRVLNPAHLGEFISGSQGSVPTNIDLRVSTDENLMMRTVVFLREARWEICIRKITLGRGFCGTAY